jgi:hypothetical protein
MTVGIAAICEADTEYPKIVFCADRQISSSVKFEHGRSKVLPITNSCWVILSTNDPLVCDLIINNVREKIKESTPQIKEVAELFSNELSTYFRQTREREVLAKYGLTYPTFIENSQTLSDVMMRTILSEVNNYDYEFDAHFLLFGLEPTPHIYLIDEEGRYKPYDYLGFVTIGSGRDQAFSELTKYAYHPNISYSEGLVRVYNAKKVAERAVGVGEPMDIAVLHYVGDGKYEIWEPVKQSLDILNSGVKELQDKEDEIYLNTVRKLAKYLHPEPEKVPNAEGMKEN